MTKYLPFYLDKNDYLVNQKSFIITGELLGTLVCFLNSSLFKFAYLNDFPELQGDTRELSKVFFQKIFVKHSDLIQEKEFQKLALLIQERVASSIEYSDLQEELEKKIYELYDINSNEIHIIKTKIVQ